AVPVRERALPPALFPPQRRRSRLLCGGHFSGLRRAQKPPGRFENRPGGVPDSGGKALSEVQNPSSSSVGRSVFQAGAAGSVARPAAKSSRSGRSGIAGGAGVAPSPFGVAGVAGVAGTAGGVGAGSSVMSGSAAGVS